MEVERKDKRNIILYLTEKDLKTAMKGAKTTSSVDLDLDEDIDFDKEQILTVTKEEAREDGS